MNKIEYGVTIRNTNYNQSLEKNQVHTNNALILKLVDILPVLLAQFYFLGLQIPQLFSHAYSEWLPSSGYDKATGPDIEIYGIANSGKYYKEVWLSVK